MAEGRPSWTIWFLYDNGSQPRRDGDAAVRIDAGFNPRPSYFSGHSTFSAAAAEVLSYLFPQASSDVDAMKDEASISRLYSGVHYRSDIERGKEHGARVGGYTVRLAQQDGAN